MSFSNFEFPNTDFYNSDLRELIAMYRKLVKEYDGIQSDITDIRNNIEDIVNKYLNKDLGQFKADLLTTVNNELTKLEEETAKFKKDIENELAEFEAGTMVSITNLRQSIELFEAKVDTRIINIENQISKVYIEMSEYKHEMAELFNIQRNELIEYIKEHIEQITRLYVVNPFTGEYEDVQLVLNDMAKYVTQGYGLTAKEYDELKLRAAEYDAKRITAEKYSSRGILLFFKELYLRMRSPFTGKYDSYEHVIYTLSNMHRGAYTAEQYDGENWDADTYDAKNWTAYEYDWTVKPVDFIGLINQLKAELVNVVEIGTGGLSATDYSNLQILHTLP